MGGGNCLFGTTVDTTTPIFRGNRSVVEVASETSNPTKLPDTEPLCAGKMETVTRCFDLFCIGKCAESSDLRLNIKSAGEIPELITKNATGEPIFAEPKPMCTIKGPAGHNVWVNIELNAIATKASDYMCLGIKKRGQEDYYDVLYTGNSSRYVDVLETDVVELVPLASSTPLSTKYTAVKAGDTAKITGAASYDFGSVYRVQITLHKGQWIEVPCDLSKLNSNRRWIVNGRLGVGQIDGKFQLLAINADTVQLAFSPNGMQWTAGSVCSSSSKQYWHAGPVYGNGMWCVVSALGDVMYSTDGKSWNLSQSKISSDIFAVYFHGGMFMAASNGGNIWRSFDGEKWTHIANINLGIVRMLGCKDNSWICGDLSGNLFCSEDGIKWSQLESNLASVSEGPHGSAYANGNFYAIDTYNSATNNIIKSENGEKWSQAFGLHCSGHCNITYFNNKLYLLNTYGTHLHIGLFRPDGTIDEI